jgi:hypothetical protein
MEVNGYVWLNKDADCRHAMGDKKVWQGSIVRAMEINEDTKSLLLIDSSATKMGMFEMTSAYSYFHCEDESGVIIPKDLPFLEKMMYISSRLSRKGGYSLLVKNMVITMSLQKGELYDGFLNIKE